MVSLLCIFVTFLSHFSFNFKFVVCFLHTHTPTRGVFLLSRFLRAIVLKLFTVVQIKNQIFNLNLNMYDTIFTKQMCLRNLKSI